MYTMIDEYLRSKGISSFETQNMPEMRGEKNITCLPDTFLSQIYDGGNPVERFLTNSFFS